MRSEFRDIEIYEAQEVADLLGDEENQGDAQYVAYTDYKDRIDEIETEVGEIADLIEDDYDLKSALEKLKELKDKLY